MGIHLSSGTALHLNHIISLEKVIVPYSMEIISFNRSISHFVDVLLVLICYFIIHWLKYSIYILSGIDGIL
uniref:Uncharacterized protein n=1 Tax=Lepeophtheirus salmonis TaxID=72036 RepID=A0A0K2VJX5_LEPSM